MVNYWCLGNSYGAESCKCKALEYDNPVAEVSLWVGGQLAGGQEVTESLLSACCVTTCLSAKSSVFWSLRDQKCRKTNRQYQGQDEFSGMKTFMHRVLMVCGREVIKPSKFGQLFQWTENKIARTSLWLSSCKESDHFSCAIYIVTTYSSQSVNQSFSAKIST